MQKTHWLILTAPVLFTALVFYFFAGDYEPSEGIVILRFTLFVWSGIVALILPHLSFPHRESGFLQLLNLPPPALLMRYLSTHRTFLLISAAAVAGLSMGSVTQFPLLFTTGLFFMTGLYLIAASGYLKIGASSQQWKENAAIKGSSRLQESIAQAQIQSGALPTLWLSLRIAITGMGGCIAGAALYSVTGPAGDLIVAAILLLTGFYLTGSQKPVTDRFFYRTNAFFSEFFLSGRQGGSEREPLRVEQLWWIPVRWRVHGWALLLQQERSLPAGRMIASGHAVLWIIAWLEPDPAAYFVFWVMFALSHHALLFLTVRRDLLPGWWAHHMDSALQWTVIRFWSQVRWLLPLVVSFSVLNLLFGMYEWNVVGWLGGSYLLSGLLLSAIAGLRVERPWAT